MNNNLSRVQIYLNPENIYILDQIAKRLKISRSQIIRDAVDIVARRYTNVAEYVKPKGKEKNALMEMAGIEKSKSGNLSLRVDEIYNIR